MTTSQSLRIERIRSPDLSGHLRPIWEDLLSRDTEGSPFLSPEWIGAWLEVFGQEQSAGALVWWEGEDPVGAAILTHGTGRLGPFRVDRAFLNASTAESVWCEQNDLLHLNGHGHAMVRDLATYVADEGIEELVLRGVRPGALAQLRESWGPHTIEGFASPAPYIDLDALRRDGADYLSCLSGNTRWQIRRSIRLYEERYGPRNIVEASEREELLPALGKLTTMHQTQWEEKGGEGALGDPVVLRFHEALLGRKHRSEGGLEPRILAVRFGDTTVGYLYNLVWRGREYSLQSGFLSEDDHRLKPGLVSHSMVVQRGLERGYTTYELLGGHPHHVRYKQSLSTGSRTNYWVEIQSRTPRMGMIRCIRFARRCLTGQRGRPGDPLLANWDTF